MPVRELLKYAPSPVAVDLKKRLIDEWRNSSSANTQPVILIERQRHSPTIHVFVVWDDWGDMEQIERSELILDAYEEVHGKQPSLDVTVAMGLTTKEADRMRIKYT